MKHLQRLVAVLVLSVTPLARGAAVDALQTLSLTVDGVARTALVYVPAKPAAEPLPLVFVFHGHGGTSRQAERSFGFDRLWPDAISVYPQGLNTAGALLDAGGNLPGWQRPGSDGDRDLHFFDALLARLRKDHAIDDQRIYCTGHSNGGAFTYLLWKSRPTVFAAVAASSAAAGYAGTLVPKPAMILGGLDDPLVPFAWQQRTMDAVRRVNRCDATAVAWAGTCKLYPSPTGTPLVVYTHPGGHAMDGTEPGLIVKFFQAHPGPTTRP